MDLPLQGRLSIVNGIINKGNFCAVYARSFPRPKRLALLGLGNTHCQKDI